jgi:hypothetical protein
MSSVEIVDIPKIFMISLIQKEPNMVFFEDSVFNDVKIDFAKLVKEIINVKNLVDKKVSFCSDISVICSNLVSIFGFEISKNLLFLIGLKSHIANVINMAKNSKNYKELSKNLKLLKNLFTINDVSLIPPYMNITDGSGEKKTFIELDVSFYEENKEMLRDEGYNWDYGIFQPDERVKYNADYVSVKGSFFEFVERCIDDRFKHDPEDIMFEGFSSVINVLLDKLLDKIKYGKLIIRHVDELLLNLEGYQNGSLFYEGSFIKHYETLYKQMFVDYPADVWKHLDPLNKFFEDNDINIENYTNHLHIYIEKIKSNCYNEMESYEVLQKGDFLRVEFTEGFYNQIIKIILSFFICLSQNIIKNFYCRFNFDTSCRIQFEHIYLSVMHSLPMVGFLDNNKQRHLEYFLITKNAFKKYSKINVGNVIE